MAWPNFIAPPLSSPRTLKIWSAVRACTSAATSSAGLPPTRFPKPRAVRPAKPRGRLASFAVRVTARRGRSVTGSFSPPRPPGAPGSPAEPLPGCGAGAAAGRVDRPRAAGDEPVGQVDLEGGADRGRRRARRIRAEDVEVRQHLQRG